jgi:hypothetical protein
VPRPPPPPEAHKAKNLKLDDPSGAGSTKMAQAVQEIQARLPKARVVYASATGLGTSVPAQPGCCGGMCVWG